MDRSEIAKELFMGEFNCAQSVVISFANNFGYSKELAAKIASGFGGGMGKTQGTCGAVTGSVMVLGLMAGERANNQDELKKQAYSKAKEFITRFESEFKSTNCMSLINCDLNSREGEAHFKEENIKSEVCAVCVARAVELIEEIG